MNLLKNADACPHSKMSRERRNVVLFIVSYVINNLASGVLYDTYVNYLQDVATSAATSFWAFYGYATFVAAALLLLVPKIGYKRLLVFCSAGTAAAFFAAVAAPTGAMIYLATLLALTGVQLHFIMLSPYVAAYTDSESDDGITWYTRTYYLGYVGYLLATYFGGLLVVVAFAQVAHIGFGQAQELTRFIEEMSPKTIEVHSDLMAAARALCQHDAGMACILGTGANSCLYDGEQIVQNTPALGYILGDEGSGAVLGKRFIHDLYGGLLSEEIFCLSADRHGNLPHSAYNTGPRRSGSPPR